MARPDPRLVSRQPMARAGGDVVHVAARPLDHALVLFPGGVLDVDALHVLVEGADAVTEGALYGSTFLGTAILTLPTAHPSDARALRAAIRNDARVAEVLHARGRRELARLLGPRTPAGATADASVRISGATVYVDVDLEAHLGALAHG